MLYPSPTHIADNDRVRNARSRAASATPALRTTLTHHLELRSSVTPSRLTPPTALTPTPSLRPRPSSPRHASTAIAILFASASAPEPPEPRAARIENLPNGFTFAPGDPGTRDPVAAAILVRSPFNFPPSVGPNPSASNGLPPFTCAAGKGGVTLSPDSVDAPIRDELSPIAAGAEFW